MIIRSVYVMSFYTEGRMGGFDWINYDSITLGGVIERLHEDMVQAVEDGVWEWRIHAIDLPDYVWSEKITEYIEAEHMDTIESPEGALVAVRMDS